jgi:molecular chaperone DnaJ
MRLSTQLRGPDLYLVLGVHPSATVDQIKAAFRRQALRYHPDKNPGSEWSVERFKLCNDAHAALTDPRKRTEYDGARNGRGVQGIARELLADFLGGRRRGRFDGRDLQYTLEISYCEAALGTRRKIRFPVPQPCERCGGGGAAPGGTRPCPSCAGTGEAREWRGLLPLPERCPRCGGQGIAVVAPCEACAGVGTVEQLRDYLVKLQRGIKDGEIKVLRGEGEPGAGGAKAGDLQVVVRVKAHPLFTEENAELRVKVPVSLSLAALGGSVEVPTLDGAVRMKVPPGTQSGRVLRLQGKGLYRGAERGDLLVTVEVETPVALGETQRRLLRELDASCDDSMTPRQNEFRARTRDEAAREESQTGLPITSGQDLHDG